MLFGVLSMSFMAIGVKCIKLKTDQNVFKIALFRGTIMWLGAYIHGRYFAKVKPYGINREMVKLMFFRGLFGTMAFYFEIIAIYLMPISLAIVIYFTNPMFISLFSYFFLGEKLSKFDIVGMFVSFLGVAIISNPDIAIKVFGGENENVD